MKGSTHGLCNLAKFFNIRGVGQSGNLYRFRMSPPVARMQTSLNNNVREQHIFNRGLVSNIDQQPPIGFADDDIRKGAVFNVPARVADAKPG